MITDNIAYDTRETTYIENNDFFLILPADLKRKLYKRCVPHVANVRTARPACHSLRETVKNGEHEEILQKIITARKNWYFIYDSQIQHQNFR